MIQVNDCRFETIIKKNLETSDLDFTGFLEVVQKEFSVPSNETFVLTTTDRIIVDADKFDKLKDGTTLYLLREINQVLPASIEEEINFVPHYNTLIESGTNEYFTEGHKSLPCALAELVDNALSATAKNTGVKSIEIRLLFNKTSGKPAIIVLDNGCGMTAKQLNNWAIYRLSKFTRENSTFESEGEGYVHPDHVPRSLNGDISFFGVGGKRAVFHMGNAVRMISRPADSPDVHELVLSKDEFQKKEQNKEDVYRSNILNRRPGNFSHIPDDEKFLRAIIADETGKKSFTVVVITGIFQEHIDYLKENFKEWTRELAHIYHYYIHGVKGNCKADISQKSDNLPRILVTLRASKTLQKINLREVEDDMQTLFINAAKDTFEFKASTLEGGIVEGVLRYHPFLYDRETYPEDPYVNQAPREDDDNEREPGAAGQARGRRDIFECFWNGRLIPYTTISGFDWCQKTGSKLPAECFSRFSGVLFTDGKFRVSATKLKFMELEKQLEQRRTHFTHVYPTQKSSRRGNIRKEFTQWLQNCHETLDKQVKFIDFKKTVTRPEVETKTKQHPWAVFSSIEQHGRRYSAGDIVKFQKAQQIIYGTVLKFFLYGNHKGDTFATGGEVEIKREPEGLYDEIIKVKPIAKIDSTATEESIKKHIEDERKKLPDHLKVDWPEGNELPENAVLPSGTPIGPIILEILNSDGDSISSRIQTGNHGVQLNVSLKVVFNGTDATEHEEILSLTAPYITKKGHYFKKIENLRNLGKHTLTLNTVLNDNITTVYGGRDLPRHKYEFIVKEGSAESFSIGEFSSPIHVNEPFNIPLNMKDCYGHPTKPPNIKPTLQSSGLELSYETTTCSEDLLTIQGVRAKGKLPNYTSVKNYELKVTLPGLKHDTETVKISLHPGNPHSLLVKSNPVEVENGNPVCFMVEVHDEAGNITRFPRLKVQCQIPGLPLLIKDCSAGKAELVTEPIKQKIVNGEPQILKATFEIPSQKQVAPVTRELMVLPSKQISRMELFSQGEEELVLKNNEKIKWRAGGVLKKLFYKLHDEAGREVLITAEIASNIEVSWGTAVNQKDLVNGWLPDLQIPTHVDGENLYQVSYRDKNVSFCFKIVPCPDEPAKLKATLPESIVKLGETLSGDIKLELVDQYLNVTKTLTSTCGKSFFAEAEGLDKSSIDFKWNESCSCIVATGVRFDSGSPGRRVIVFQYKDFTETVVLEVTAGVPSQIKLVSGPEQPLQVLNGQDIPTPFLLQLCDEWGNSSPDKNMNVEIKPPVTLTFTTEVLPPMDTEGKTCIKVNRVEGSMERYVLEFKGSLNGKSVPGPSVNLILLPDPNKPVRFSVDFDKSAKFSAGGKFPVFSVTVFSEEGSPMTAFKPADLSMLLWEGPLSMRPTTITELKYKKPVENERKDCYEFREEEIPTRVGEYTVEFSLQTNTKENHLRTQISVNVVANEPVKIEPACQQQTPVVFYCTDIASRILVENMTLKITDQFGNLAGQNLNGTVFISIKCAEEERSRILPMFDGRTNTISVSIEEGSALINSLAIMENSPGENGSRYILLFKPEVRNPPTSLSPFELPFHFYNDAENQQKKVQLMKKKDELTEAIKECNKNFDSIREQNDLLKNNVEVSTRKEVSLRNELNERGIKTDQIEDSKRCLEQKKSEVERIEQTPRRIFSINRKFSGPDVLGMVGQLAFVADDAVARVISWMLQGHMDCVITMTTEAAQKFYEDTKGNQQVLALDSILVYQEDRPLPHIRNGQPLFKPSGNPTIARKHLIYRDKQLSCDRNDLIKVFKNLLGDTILMDDFISATNYRKALVEKRIRCPTILTRNGEIVSANGILGGSQNRAPPIDKMKVFGAPLPDNYEELKEQIDLLHRYCAAVEEKEKVEKDLKDHSPKWVDEMIQTKTQTNVMTEELEGINKQLASVPVRPEKRASGNSEESPGIVSKRQRRRSKDPPELFSEMN